MSSRASDDALSVAPALASVPSRAAGLPIAVRRIGAGILALACWSGAAWLASQHPLAPFALLAGLVLWSGLVLAWPSSALLFVPLLLPVANFSPWTGWITFEEFDVLVLGALGAGYARAAFDSPTPPRDGSRGYRLWLAALLLLMAASALVSFARGFGAAAGFDLLQGYDGPMNSVRMLKSLVLAGLAVPLLRAALQRDGSRATRMLASGMLAGLALASLAVVWERVAFTDLLDFSVEYRVTGLFWETHVGGAPLDGFLALSIPFTYWAALRMRGAGSIIAGLLVTALAAYAALCTFSRGLYLALAVSFVVVALWPRHGRIASAEPWWRRLLRRGALAAGVTLLCLFAFRAGGYRTMAAMMVAFGLIVVTGPIARRLPATQWAGSCAAGLLLGAMIAVMTPWIPKAPYVAFAVVAGSCALAVLRDRRHPGFVSGPLAVALALAALISCAAVAQYWGGAVALRDSLVAIVALGAVSVWNARARSPVLPATMRPQLAALLAGLVAATAVAVLSGGDFMRGRFVTSQQDLSTRTTHWRDSLDTLTSRGDWLVGKGLGRFPAVYAAEVRAAEMPGSYRVENAADDAVLVLSGPRRDAVVRETLEVVQRVPLGSGGPFVAVFDARAREDTNLFVGICEQHLLYPRGCAVANVLVKASGWRHVVTGLEGVARRGSWYAPRLGFLILAVADPGRSVELDHFSVAAADGSNLVRNGDWSNGMSEWFFKSDRSHLPWHIKSLPLHLLFEQGVLGVAAFSLLVLTALARVAGPGRQHPLAPALAGGIVGFLTVGAFDSLLDFPRLAFLFWIVLLVSLLLPRPDERSAAA